MNADLPVGFWYGEARVIVGWAQQRRLKIQLNLRSDGSAEGRVGDAVLVGGIVRPNRGVLGRLFGVNTDFVVRAELSGEVLHAPPSRRKGVSIPFNMSGDSLRGSVFTTGAKAGPPDRQQVVAADMVLSRR
jgi:hypothetical protein